MPRNVLYAREQPDLSAYVQASIDAASGTCDPETGHYATLHYTGIGTRERADEIKRALFRAARYLECSMSATVHRSDDGYWVEFRAISKKHARAYMIKKYGTNRANWPYSPRRGDPNYG